MSTVYESSVNTRMYLIKRFQDFYLIFKNICFHFGEKCLGLKQQKNKQLQQYLMVEVKEIGQMTNDHMQKTFISICRKHVQIYCRTPTKLHVALKILRNVKKIMPVTSDLLRIKCRADCKGCVTEARTIK